MNIITELQRTLSLGFISIPWIVVPLLLSWISYNILIKTFYRERKQWLRNVDSVLFNGLFIVLIVWKLSPVVFQFQSVIKNPAAALYLPGGTSGFILGAVLALIYYSVTALKQKSGRRRFLGSMGFNIVILSVLILGISAGTGLVLNRVYEESGTAESMAGSQAPGFVLRGEDGNVYRLSDYTGETVVLNFWASWCPPCRAELPELKSFYTEPGSDDVAFLSINLFTSERDPAGLPDFIKEEGLPFPVLYDITGQVAEDYGVQSIPTTVIISGDGVISAFKTGAVTDSWLKRAVAK